MGKKNKGRKPNSAGAKAKKMTAASACPVQGENDQEHVVDTGVPRDDIAAEKEVNMDPEKETETIDAPPQLNHESSTASMTEEVETIADKRVTFTEPTASQDYQESTEGSNEVPTTVDQGQDEPVRKTGDVGKRMSSGISNIINRLETSSKLRDSPTLARKRSMVQWERVRMNEFLTLWELVSDPRFAPRRKSLEGMLAAHVEDTDGNKNRVSASEFLNTILKSSSDDVKSRLLEEIDRCRSRIEADPAEAAKDRQAVKMPRELIEDLAQQSPLSLDMALSSNEAGLIDESAASEFSFDTSETESAQHIAEITNLMSVLAASYVRLEREEKSFATANSQIIHTSAVDIADNSPGPTKDSDLELPTAPSDNKEATLPATADVLLPTASVVEPETANTETVSITTVTNNEDISPRAQGAAVAAEAEVDLVSVTQTFTQTNQETPQNASETSSAEVSPLVPDSSATPVPMTEEPSVAPTSTDYTNEPCIPVVGGVSVTPATTPPTNDTTDFYVAPPVQHTATRGWVSEIIHKLIVAVVLLVGGAISIPIVLFTWPVLLPILLILRYFGVWSRFGSIAHSVKRRVYPSAASTEISNVCVCGAINAPPAS